MRYEANRASRTNFDLLEWVSHAQVDSRSDSLVALAPSTRRSASLSLADLPPTPSWLSTLAFTQCARWEATKSCALFEWTRVTLHGVLKAWLARFVFWTLCTTLPTTNWSEPRP